MVRGILNVNRSNHFFGAASIRQFFRKSYLSSAPSILPSLASSFSSKPTIFRLSSCPEPNAARQIRVPSSLMSTSKTSLNCRPSTRSSNSFSTSFSLFLTSFSLSLTDGDCTLGMLAFDRSGVSLGQGSFFSFSFLTLSRSPLFLESQGRFLSSDYASSNFLLRMNSCTSSEKRPALSLLSLLGLGALLIGDMDAFNLSASFGPSLAFGFF